MKRDPLPESPRESISLGSIGMLEASQLPQSLKLSSKHGNSIVGRMIVDEPAAGSWNMAVDAAILEHIATQDAPTLRFYRWSKPTLSLGYFQSAADRTLHASSGGIDLVRRTTGGGAIVHDCELTYSVIVPQGNRSHGADQTLYHDVHQAVIGSLQRIGVNAMRFGDYSSSNRPDEPFLCFQRRTREDLIVSGYKVLGSAQRRGAGGLLQHGSLLLASSAAAPELPGLLNLAAPRDRRAASCEAPGQQCTAAADLADSVASDIAAELSRLWGVKWSLGQLRPEEKNAAFRIQEKRFTSPSWNFKR
jgi:lipoyl(octanoyl) transferase